MVQHSDVISFHAYDSDMEVVKEKIHQLENYNRPLLCTEYMARTNDNTFEKVMPILKENNIAAINWGLVSGKSNTIYPWSSWREKMTEEPKIWFHDIFRPDGTPYSREEVDFIRKMVDEK